MPRFLRPIAVAFAILLPFTGAALAQAFTPQQRGEIERIVRDYLLRNPEVLQDVFAELEKRQAQAQLARSREAIRQHAALLFNSPRQVTLGNPQGDVTLVEFFDYNCGYCKRALADMLALLETDRKLKVVLKEFPVLGQGSVEAAQVSVAVSMQDRSGRKYLDFHRRLLTGRGQADRARALAAAKEAGFDTARLERDANGVEVRATLEESFKLAEALGLNGTPSYVIGEEVIVGAVGLAALKEKIAQRRCGKPSC